MAETNMTLKQSYNSSGEKIYPLVSIDGIIDALGIDDPDHRGKNLIALSLQGLNINPNKVDSSILTVVQDDGELAVKEGIIDIKGLPVHTNSGLQVGGNIHSFRSISVSNKGNNNDPTAYGTLELSGDLTNGAKLTLMKKGNGNQPESFFFVGNEKLKYNNAFITSTTFNFNNVLQGKSTMVVSTAKLIVGNKSNNVGSDIYGGFRVLNGTNNTSLDVSSNMVTIHKDTSILGKLTVQNDTTVTGNTTLNGTLTTGEKLTVSNNTDKSGAQIYGDTSIYGKFNVLDGAVTLLGVSSDNVTIGKDTSITGKLTVGRGAKPSSAQIYGEFKVLNGTSTLLGVSSDKVTIHKDTSILGKLTVGNSSSRVGSDIYGDTSIKGILSLSTSTGNKPSIEFNRGTSTDSNTDYRLRAESDNFKVDYRRGSTTWKEIVDVDGYNKQITFNGDLYVNPGQLSSANASHGKKLIYNDEKNQYFRICTEKNTSTTDTLLVGCQILAGGTLYGSADAGIGVYSQKSGVTTSTYSGYVNIMPSLNIHTYNSGVWVDIFKANDSSITNYKPTTISSTLNVTDMLTVGRDLKPSGAQIYGSLNVTGQTTLASGSNNGIVIHTSNDSLYGKKVIWSNDGYLRIKAFKHTANDKNSGVQLLVGGDNISDEWDNAQVGIDLSSRHTANNIWTNIITMKPAVQINGSLTVTGRITANTTHNLLCANNQLNLGYGNTKTDLFFNYQNGGTQQTKMYFCSGNKSINVEDLMSLYAKDGYFKNLVASGGATINGTLNLNNSYLSGLIYNKWYSCQLGTSQDTKVFYAESNFINVSGGKNEKCHIYVSGIYLKEKTTVLVIYNNLSHNQNLGIWYDSDHEYTVGHYKYAILICQGSTFTKVLYGYEYTLASLDKILIT